MGIYIPNIKKPKDCDECWTKFQGFGMVEHNPEWGTFYCKIAKGFCVDPRTKCPIIEVPQHGDLIDRDAIIKEYEEDILRCHKDLKNPVLGEKYRLRISKGIDERLGIIDFLKSRRTILEADREET